MADGLWYSPYMKVYSISEHDRLAEISNYPVMEEDNSFHVYDKDEFFIVEAKDTVKMIKDGTVKPVFPEADGTMREVGEKANKKGTPLPGEFPKFIPAKSNGKSITDSNSLFSYPIIPELLTGQLVKLIIESVWVTTSKIIYLSKEEVDEIIKQIPSGVIKLKYNGLLSIQYKRIF